MINKLFLITLGFFIFTLTFYRRFIILRLPKSLYFVENLTIKYIFILFVLISIFTSCLIIKTYIYILLQKSLSDNIFTKIGIKMHEMIENAISEAFSAIVNNMPNHVNYISKLCEQFYQLFGTRPETFFLFILYLIRIIILITFLIDVFFYFQFNYMYKAFNLLIITLLIKILFYILRDYASNVEELKLILVITDKGVDLETGLPVTSYQFNDEYKDKIDDLKYHIQQFILCNKLSGYLDNYDRYTAFFAPYINIFIYSLYLIGWFYILYCNKECIISIILSFF